MNGGMQAGVMIKSPLFHQMKRMAMDCLYKFCGRILHKEWIAIDEDLLLIENRYDLTTIFFNNADYAQPFEKTAKLNLDRILDLCFYSF